MAQTSLNSTGVASSGALSLQSNGTTEAIGISTGQVATLAQNPILTSGTANGVAYLNGSKVLTTGSALVFDGTNTTTTGTVTVTKDGVGVRAASAVTNFSHITLGNDIGGGVTYLESGKGGTGSYVPLAFFTNGSEKLRLDNSGNLGLGVTPSAWGSTYRMQQIGLTAATGGRTAASQAYLSANWYHDGTNNRYITTAAASQYQQDSGVHYWFNAASGTAGNAITFTQAMTLDASGNLGVGTTSPTGRIHSSTDSELTFASTSITGTNANFSRWSNTGGSLYIGVDSSVGSRIISNAGAYTSCITTSNSTSLAFGTSNTERMRIDSSGNLLLKATSAGTSAVGVLGMGNATAPSSSPAGMGQLYVESGALKYRGSSGTITTIAAA